MPSGQHRTSDRLRVADADDSRDVVDSPAAAHLPRDVPGRSVLRVGPHQVLTFQAAYSGGPPHQARWSARRSGRPSAGGPRSERPDGANRAGRAAVDAVRRAHRALGGPSTPALARPRSRHDRALDARLAQHQNPNRRRSRPRSRGTLLTIGSADPARRAATGPTPRRPRRPGCWWSSAARIRSDHDAAHDRHRGRRRSDPASRSMRSTAARPGAPVGLDRVGDVVVIDDVERVMDCCAARCRLVAGSPTASTHRAPPPDHRRHRRVRGGDRSGERRRSDRPAHPARDEGRAVDIHVVAAAGRRSEVPPAIFSALGQRIVLRCGTVDDALMLGVPLDVAEGPTRPGLPGAPAWPFRSRRPTAADRRPRHVAALRSDGTTRSGVPRLPTSFADPPSRPTGTSPGGCRSACTATTSPPSISTWRTTPR